MKILLIILIQFPLSLGLLFAQSTADTVFDFNTHISNKETLFIRTITITQQQMCVTMTHDFADNYVFKSTDMGTNFDLVVKDTTPYSWTKDSLKAHDYPGSAIPYCAVAIDNEIFMSRTGGIISKIDYQNNKFINDTLFGTSTIVRSLEYYDNTLLTCAGFDVFKSHDQGQTWQHIAPDISKFDYDASYFLNNTFIKIINKSIYYLFTSISNLSGYNATYLMKTIDGGLSWKIVTKITSGSAANFTITQNGNIFICGSIVINNEKQPNYYYEWMIKSSDDGLTWKKVIGNPEKFNGSLFYVKFYDNNFGVSYYSGFLYYTFDGGDTWDYIYTPIAFGISISTVEFWDERTVLIGDRRLGLILKLTLDPTSVIDVTDELQFKLFPNPAVEYIEIAVDINPTVNRRADIGSGIKIYNVLGECVINESIHPMSPSHRMNVGHLPRGVYYLRIGSRSQMFVKI